MLLGLSAVASPVPPPAVPMTVERKVENVAVKTSERAQTKSGYKNNQRQKDPEQAAQVMEPLPVPILAKPVTSAWGGAAHTTVKHKSMSEIQKEEARATAILAMQREASGMGRQSSSGWANIAASGGSSAWSSGTVKPVTPTSIGVNPAASARVAPIAVAPVRPKQQVVAQTRKSAVDQQSRGANTSAKAAEEFGASMPPALEKWCKDQMTKITGSDDLTLVSFCLTLNDPVEIRQYLTTYLGLTSQVNNFATEFIRMTVGEKSKQEEWETPGSAKKGKRKKGAR